MRKTIVLTISFLLIFGISTAVIAQAETSWKNNFQNEFSDLEYENPKSWGTENLNRAQIIQVGDDNLSSIKQNGSKNHALTIQNGNHNSARINQRGVSNSALIKQFSDNNSAVINQIGSNNKAVILQN